jgi:uncharacterized protein
MQQRNQDIELESEKFLTDEVPEVKDAIQGAMDIIAEWINEDQQIREKIRDKFRKQAIVSSRVNAKKKEEAGNFEDYFDFSEPLRKCPSHRYLAMMRGEQEGLLQFSISIPEDIALEILQRQFVKSSRKEGEIIKEAAYDAWKRLMSPSIENQIKSEYKEKADDEAISVFVDNLEQLLLAPPLGEKPILAIDPGFRTGCKVICIDAQGNLLANDTIYPHPP